MKLNCTLETRLSKSGKEYTVCVIKITDRIEKLVFLTPSEIELLRINKNDNINKPDTEFWELPQ